MRRTSKPTYTGLLAAAVLLAAGAGTAHADGLSSIFSTVGSIYSPDEELPTDIECQDAWEQSPAYPTCGDRSQAQGSTAETVEAVGNTCYIASGCEYYASGQTLGEGTDATTVVLKRMHTEWQGGVGEAAKVRNCRGHIEWFC